MANEKRLIDANALISQYPQNVFTAQIDYAQGMRDVIDDIQNAPTVDAVEVVHGRWIVVDDDYYWDDEIDDEYYVVLECMCSECGERTRIDSPSYCPNCGAKMDGDGNGT